MYCACINQSCAGTFLSHDVDVVGVTVGLVVGMRTGMNAGLMTKGTGEGTGVEALLKDGAIVLLVKALQRGGQELNSGIVKGRSTKQLKLFPQGLYHEMLQTIQRISRFVLQNFLVSLMGKLLVFSQSLPNFRPELHRSSLC